MREAEWNNTILATERAKTSSFYEEPTIDSRHGTFKGRQIIGRDMSVSGGVYLGGGKREAIVVDEKYGQLKRVYARLREDLEREQEHGSIRGRILRKVYDIVQQELPYNQARADELAAQVGPDGKMALDVFIQEKAGVCRHQALLATYLFQKLKEDGIVQGTTSIDRNAVSGVGGHAWVRYANRLGEVFIIDPAQNYIGPLKSTKLENRWFYERPEDKG